MNEKMSIVLVAVVSLMLHSHGVLCTRPHIKTRVQPHVLRGDCGVPRRPIACREALSPFPPFSLPRRCSNLREHFHARLISQNYNSGQHISHAEPPRLTNYKEYRGSKEAGGQGGGLREEDEEEILEYLRRGRWDSIVNTVGRMKRQLESKALLVQLHDILKLVHTMAAMKDLNNRMLHNTNGGVASNTNACTSDAGEGAGGENVNSLQNNSGGGVVPMEFIHCVLRVLTSIERFPRPSIILKSLGYSLPHDIRNSPRNMPPDLRNSPLPGRNSPMNASPASTLWLFRQVLLYASPQTERGGTRSVDTEGSSEKDGKRGKGLKPFMLDAKSFEILLGKAAHVSLSEAIIVHQVAQEYNCNVSIKSWESLLQSCVPTGAWQEAQMILNNMLKALDSHLSAEKDSKAPKHSGETHTRQVDNPQNLSVTLRVPSTRALNTVLKAHQVAARLIAKTGGVRHHQRIQNSDHNSNPNTNPNPNPTTRAGYNVASPNVARAVSKSRGGGSRGVRFTQFPNQRREIDHVYANALKIMEDMRARSTSVNAISYKMLMGFPVLDGSGWKRALSLFLKMQREDPEIEPQESILHSLLTAVAQSTRYSSGTWKTALSILHQFETAAGRSPPALPARHDLGVKGSSSDTSTGIPREKNITEKGRFRLSTRSTQTYNILINIMARGRQHQRAIEYFEEMGRQHIAKDAITYTSIIDACAKVGAWAKALHVYSKMLSADEISQSSQNFRENERGRNNNNTNNNFKNLNYYKSDRTLVSAQSAAALIKAHTEAGEVERALTLYTEHLSNNLASVISTRHIVCGLVKYGHWDRALELIPKLRNKSIKFDEIIYTGLIAAASKSLKIEKALELLENMQNELRTPPNQIIYTSLIHACGRTNHMDLAIKVFNEMIARGITPDVVACNTLLGSIARRGWGRVSECVFMFMLKKGIQPNANSYAQLIYAQATDGKFVEAQVLFDLMRDYGISPSRSHYNGLIKAYNFGGKFETALLIFEEMKREGIQPDTSTYQSLLRQKLILDDSDKHIKSEPRETSAEVRSLIYVLGDNFNSADSSPPAQREHSHTHSAHTPRIGGDSHDGEEPSEGTSNTGDSFSNSGIPSGKGETPGELSISSGVNAQWQGLRGESYPYRYFEYVEMVRRYRENLVPGYAGDEASLPSPPAAPRPL